ncbi:MAG: hypothetical protein KKA60_00730, partial [Proteobacteria bacterium]|nr:hypothetical protein [Pseudomonadota bacterium]
WIPAFAGMTTCCRAITLDTPWDFCHAFSVTSHPKLKKEWVPPKIHTPATPGEFLHHGKAGCGMWHNLNDFGQFGGPQDMVVIPSWEKFFQARFSCCSFP